MAILMNKFKATLTLAEYLKARSLVAIKFQRFARPLHCKDMSHVNKTKEDI
jgi:hypothetical protein